MWRKSLHSSREAARGAASWATARMGGWETMTAPGGIERTLAPISFR